MSRMLEARAVTAERKLAVAKGVLAKVLYKSDLDGEFRVGLMEDYAIPLTDEERAVVEEAQP